MSNASVTESPLQNSHKKRPPFRSWWKSPLAIALTALVIAVIAAAVAIAAWLSPAHGHSFSSQQSAQAKTNVCSAYTTVRNAVFEKLPKANPGDVVADLSNATHIQLSLLGGGAYLRETVAAEPAAPTDLAKAASSMGNTLEQMGMSYLARAGKKAQDPLRKNLGDEIRQINPMCAPNNKK
jgi:hypothetical protein